MSFDLPQLNTPSIDSTFLDFEEGNDDTDSNRDEIPSGIIVNEYDDISLPGQAKDTATNSMEGVTGNTSQSSETVQPVDYMQIPGLYICLRCDYISLLPLTFNHTQREHPSSAVLIRSFPMSTNVSNFQSPGIFQCMDCNESAPYPEIANHCLNRHGIIAIRRKE